MALRFLITGLATVVGAVLMVLMVHPGIDLLRKVIGKDRCFDSHALNGCSTWLFGTLLCAEVVFLAWPQLKYPSLMLIPLVPIAATMFWTAYFCFKATNVRKREFAIENGLLVRQNDGTAITPEFVIHYVWYDQTGPGSGYSADLMHLGAGNNIVATNVYIDQSLAEHMLAGVLKQAGPHGCRLLDIVFAVQMELTRWQLVRLHPSWTPILCGAIAQLPEEDRKWWRQWCQPEFGPLNRVVLSSETVGEHLERLVAAYPSLDARNPADAPDHDLTPTLNLMMGTIRPRDNVRALRALLSRHATVNIMTSGAHSDEIRRAGADDAGVICEFDDDGVEIETIRSWKKSA